MKYCPNCGSELQDNDAKFCPNCGSNLNVGSTTTEEKPNTTYNFPKRDIAVSVILSIITCGIYGIYWFICLTDEVNAASNEKDTTGGVAFLLTLVTCGIYGIYWAYRIGQKLVVAAKNENRTISDNSIIYLVLQLFGLGIINYCLIQNELNHLEK